MKKAIEMAKEVAKATQTGLATPNIFIIAETSTGRDQRGASGFNVAVDGSLVYQISSYFLLLYFGFFYSSHQQQIRMKPGWMLVKSLFLSAANQK
jgi:hypothetical protein